MSLHNACQCRRAGPARLAHYLQVCRLQQRLDSDFMRDDTEYRVAQVLLTALFNTVFCCLKSGTDLVYLFTFVWYLTHDYINCAVKQFNFSNRGVIIIHKLFITCDRYAVNGCARSKESFYLLHIVCQCCRAGPATLARYVQGAVTVIRSSRRNHQSLYD